MDMRKLLVLLGAAALMTGCGADIHPMDPPEEGTVTEMTENSENIAETVTEATEAPAERPVVWQEDWPDTAVKLRYVEAGEAAMEYETQDPELISVAIEALKGMTLGDEVEVRYTDSGEYLEFTDGAGEVYGVAFEHGNFTKGDQVWETEGYKPLGQVLRDIRDRSEG